MNKKFTKSLKQLYNESLLCEMPYMSYKPYDGKDLDDDIKNRKMAEDLIEGRIGKLVGNFNDNGKIDIYCIGAFQDINYPLAIYALIHENKHEIIGAVNILEILSINKEKYFSTNGLWKKQTFKSSVIFNFFIKWLLPEYKIIISDNETTELGKKFWIKIIEYGLANNKECGIFNTDNNKSKDTKQFTRLYKMEDFLDAWKDEPWLKQIYIIE